MKRLLTTLFIGLSPLTWAQALPPVATSGTSATLPPPPIARPFRPPADAYWDLQGRQNLRENLQNIKVLGAWAQGARGAGVTVAVIDSGVNASHKELAGQVVKGVDALGGAVGSSDVRDFMGHGTHVAGIIVGKANNWGMVGVAPEAKVMPFRVIYPSNQIVGKDIRAALEAIPKNVPIANMSLGFSADNPDLKAGMQRATARGVLSVVAAGNRGLDSPDDYPARYAKESWAKGRIIVVGAGFPLIEGANGWVGSELADFSNRAGDLKQFYLVAPGVSIYSSIGMKDELTVMDGTSMAAPHVAGVAALIKSRWPKLKAEEIASILFKTATDLGDKGVDAIYGHGLLNADRAVRPVGPTVVPTPGGRAPSVHSIGMVAPAASGNSLKTQAIRAVAFDEFKRDFSIDLAAAVVSTPAPALAGTLAQAAQRAARVEQVFANGARLLASVGQSETASGLDAPRATLGGFSFVQRFDNGAEWAVGGNGFADDFFGAANHLDATRELAAVGAHPLFALVPGHSHAGASLPLAGNWKMKAGVLTSLGERAFASQAGPSPELPAARLVLGGISHVKEDSAIGLTLGQLAEGDSLLGSRSGEGLRIEGTPRTRFATLEAAARWADKWAGFASYTVALTPAHQNSANSLIAGNSALRATALAAGVIRADQWTRGDRLSFSVAQPLRLRSGSLNMSVAEGEDEAGNPVFGHQSLSMAPGGREWRSEVHYQMPLARHQSIGGFLMHRTQPGHDDTQGAEVAVGMRWNQSF